MKRSTIAVVSSISLFTVSLSTALGGPLPVSIREIGQPAVDLVHEGQLIDKDEAIDLHQSGVDLSQLDPAPSDIWQPTAHPPVSQAEWEYPENGATVEFDSFVGSPADLLKARVLFGNGNEARTFQLNVSLYGHAALARAALLRRLGYPVASPKHYRSLKIRFQNAKARTDFVDRVVLSSGKADSVWITSKPESSLELTIQDVSLEPAQVDMPQYHWGTIIVNPPQRVDHIQGRRAIRGLLVPLVLFDMGESANVFSWEAGRIDSGHVVLSHPYAENFSEVTYQDLRWAGRRISALTREDFTAVVAAGEYPADVSALLVEKLIARRNHMMQLLDLRVRSLPYNPRITLGAVRRGQLHQPHYDGYAQTFKLEDPRSPLRLSEMSRFFAIEGISQAIRHATSRFNSELVAQGMSDLVARRQERLDEDLKKHIEQNPGTPFVMPIRTWGGLLGSAGINISRNVMTGSYYGAESAVQLVDNFSITVSGGYFRGLQGIRQLTPSSSLNLNLQRNYIHIRPIRKMNDALTTDWRDLYVPGFMQNELAGMINEISDTDPFAVMLDKLKEGEMLMVTDSLVGSARLSAGFPMALLMQLPVPGFRSAGGSVGVGGQRSLLRRTTFTRTRDGVQVYLQSVDSKSVEFSFDLNWYVNVLRLSQTRKDGEATTRAFLFDRMPEKIEEKRALAVALKVLFQRNSTEVLEEGFPYYRLEHDVSSRINRGRFLRSRWSGVEESHIARIQLPADPEKRYRPEDTERTLLSHRISRVTGTNDYGFFSEVLRASPTLLKAMGMHPQSPLYGTLTRILPFLGLGGDRGGDNPANTFLGSATWKSIATEAEITPGRESSLVTTIERHWGGWKLSHGDLMELLDRIETTLQPLHLDRPLVRRDVFNTTRSIQVYDIAQNLIVFERGMQKIRAELIDAPSVESMFHILVYLNGVDEFYAWCEKNGRPTGVGQFSFRAMRSPHAFRVREGRKTTDFLCIMPWMKDVIKLRRRAPEQPLAAREEDEVELSAAAVAAAGASPQMDRASIQTHQRRARWNTRLMALLEQNSKQANLLEWIGPENYHFSLTVGGFRTNDENSDFEYQYLSDTLGNLESDEDTGIFGRFARRTKIMAHELYARYLSEGF